MLAEFGIYETYKIINEKNYQIAARAKESPYFSTLIPAPAD